MKIYNKASRLLSKSYQGKNKHGTDKDKETKNIVIVGGGATGVGVAGALADLNHNSPSSSSEKIKVMIITASSTVLPGFDTKIIDEVVRILHKKGVSIRTHTTAAEVRKDSIVVGVGGGAGSRAEIPSSLTIWTPGIKGYDLPVEPQVEKTNNGRIVINDYCQTNEYPNIFCLGDISVMKEPSGKITNPPLGHIAISQAIYLAESIANYFIHNIKPVQKFQSNVNVRILSLGLNDYIGLVNNVVVTGDIARIAKSFKQEAHLESISSGEITSATKIYKNDPVSSLLSSIFITVFSISKTLKNKILAYDTNKMSNHHDEDSVTEKVEELANKIKSEARDAKVNIKDVQENVVESKVNDIQDNPEFQLWEKRLEKKVPQRQDDNSNGTISTNKENE